MWCLIDWPVVMLDGPRVAAGHSHFSFGTTICSDPELKHHQTSYPHTNMSFVQWCALEKSAQHAVHHILVYGTCAVISSAQADTLGKLTVYCWSVRAGECERVQNKENSKML